MGEIRYSDVSSRKKWKQVQALRKMFWDRWRREYLPTLTTRGKWRNHTTNLRIGELVIICDDDTKRTKWPLGRITNIMPGNDDIVRVAEVKTSNGTYTRPVAKLCRLEDESEVPQGEGYVGVKTDL